MPPEHWTKAKEAFYAYDQEGLKCETVLEPSGLLCLVSGNEHDLQTLPSSLCVFNKKQLHKLRVSVDGRRRISVNYLEKTGSRQTRRKMKIEAVKITFQPRALTSEGEEPESFSFLGLKGDFDIYVDRVTHLPVRVSGKISTFGKIDINLQEASLERLEK